MNGSVKNLVTDISSMSTQLKIHYHYFNNEFFVDPDKKFTSLLGKLIVKY